MKYCCENWEPCPEWVKLTWVGEMFIRNHEDVNHVSLLFLHSFVTYSFLILLFFPIVHCQGCHCCHPEAAPGLEQDGWGEGRHGQDFPLCGFLLCV